MKFAVVGPTHPFRGGIAHHTTLLVKHLSERHDVLFLSFLRQYPRWLFPGRSDRDPSREPLRVECTYSLDPLNPVTWRATAQRIARFAPDGVILPWWVPFWAPAWWVMSRMVRRQTRTRLVFLCHNVLPHETGFWHRRAAQMVLRAGDGFVVQSTGEAKRLRGLLPNGEEAIVRIIPHPSYAALAQGKPMTREEARATLDLPTDATVLLFFGLVRPYKGLDILVEALPEIRKQLDARLLAVGEWWMPKEPMLQRIAKLGFQDEVTIVDRYIPNEALSCYFRAADVAVFPYREATGSGAVQLALGFGLPVVASRVNGVTELMDETGHTTLVPPGNPTALAEGIRNALQSQTRSTAFPSPESAADSWRAMTDAIEELARS